MGNNTIKELSIDPKTKFGTVELDKLWKAYAVPNPQGSLSLPQEAAKRFLDNFLEVVGTPVEKPQALALVEGIARLKQPGAAFSIEDFETLIVSASNTITARGSRVALTSSLKDRRMTREEDRRKLDYVQTTVQQQHQGEESIPPQPENVVNDNHENNDNSGDNDDGAGLFGGLEISDTVNPTESESQIIPEEHYQQTEEHYQQTEENYQQTEEHYQQNEEIENEEEINEITNKSDVTNEITSDVTNESEETYVPKTRSPVVSPSSKRKRFGIAKRPGSQASINTQLEQPVQDETEEKSISKVDEVTTEEPSEVIVENIEPQEPVNEPIVSPVDSLKTKKRKGIAKRPGINQTQTKDDNVVESIEKDTETSQEKVKTPKQDHKVKIDSVSNVKKAESEKNRIKDRLKKFEKDIGTWQAEIEKIAETQTNLLKQKSNFYKNLIEKRNLLKETEANQIKLIEEENYDEAELLNEKQKKLNVDIKELQQRIIDVSHKRIALEDDKCDVYSNILSNLRRETIQELKKLEEEQSKVVEESKKLIREENQDTEMALKEQRIERDLHHIEIDMKSLEEKNQRIQSKISSQTTNQREIKDQWVTKRNEVKEEIKSSLQRLEILRQEEAECDEKIMDIDRDIDTVSKRFVKETSEIEAEKQKLSNEKEKLINEMEEIQHDKETHQNKLKGLRSAVESEENTLTKIESLISQCRTKIKTLDQKILECNETKSFEEQILDEEFEEKKDLKQLKQTLNVHKIENEELSNQILNIRTEIRGTEQSIKTIKDTIPNLDEEKKIAAKNKNFKVAQALQKQMQMLQEELTEKGELLSSLDVKLKRTMEENEQKRTKLEELEKEVKIKEKQADVERLKKSMIRIKDIQKQIQRCIEQSPSDNNQIQNLEFLHETEKSKIAQIKIIHDISESDNLEETENISNSPENTEGDGNLFSFLEVSEPTEVTNEISEAQSQEVLEPDTENTSNDNNDTFASKEVLQQQLESLEKEIDSYCQEENYQKAEELQLIADDIKSKIEQMK